MTLEGGPGGLSTDPFRMEDGTTLTPGSTGRLITRLDRQLPDGPWKATLTAWSGSVRQEITGTITFPRNGVQPAESVRSREGSRWLVFGGAAALLSVPLVAFLLWRPRRRQVSR